MHCLNSSLSGVTNSANIFLAHPLASSSSDSLLLLCTHSTHGHPRMRWFSVSLARLLLNAPTLCLKLFVVLTSECKSRFSWPMHLLAKSDTIRLRDLGCVQTEAPIDRQSNCNSSFQRVKIGLSTEAEDACARNLPRHVSLFTSAPSLYHMLFLKTPCFKLAIH